MAVQNVHTSRAFKRPIIMAFRDVACFHLCGTIFQYDLIVNHFSRVDSCLPQTAGPSTQVISRIAAVLIVVK